MVVDINVAIKAKPVVKFILNLREEAVDEIKVATSDGVQSEMHIPFSDKGESLWLDVHANPHSVITLYHGSGNNYGYWFQIDADSNIKGGFRGLLVRISNNYLPE